MTAVEVDFSELPNFTVPIDADARKVIANELAADLRDVERLMRCCEARVVSILDRADRLGVYSVDGHRSIRSWAAATVNWSGRECRDRARTVHLVRDLPSVADDLAAGTIAIAPVRELARLRANPRCGEHLVDAADELVNAAKTLPFDDFRIVAEQWEQFADADGAHNSHEGAHQGRRVSTSAMGDTFHLQGQFGAIQGAEIAEVLSRFEQAEFDEEWAALKATHGDDLTVLMLERTSSQRRADALVAIFLAAVSHPVGGQAPAPVVNIIVDQATFEEYVEAAVTGTPPPAPDPTDMSRRCETDAGVHVDPVHAVAAALIGHVRRVVMNSAGVVIDMGRKSRCFAGSSRVAAFLQGGRRCLWPGCGRTHRTQIDHSTDWQYLGVTAPGNSGPLCPWHNPFKNNGYHVRRDENAHWHVHRPDGTEIHPV